MVFFNAQTHDYSGYSTHEANGSTSHVIEGPDGSKIVIILPGSGIGDQTSYSLDAIYMSYTERYGSNDLAPKVWKASSGALELLPCPDGGVAWAASGRFAPLSQTATGQFDLRFRGRC